MPSTDVQSLLDDSQRYLLDSDLSPDAKDALRGRLSLARRAVIRHGDATPDDRIQAMCELLASNTVAEIAERVRSDTHIAGVAGGAIARALVPERVRMTTQVSAMLEACAKKHASVPVSVARAYTSTRLTVARAWVSVWRPLYWPIALVAAATVLATGDFAAVLDLIRALKK